MPSIRTVYNNPALITVYGTEVQNFRPDSTVAAPAFVALIKGAQILDKCVRLPFPIVIPVPAAGTAINSIECGFLPGEVDKWDVPDTELDSYAYIPGQLSEILFNLSDKGISGGIELDNARIEDGEVCVDIHIWAKIEYLGRKVEIDERLSACVDVSCITVWENSWAKLKLCLRGKNRVCAELCVGKWGFERCWDACAKANLNQYAISVASDCCKPVEPVNNSGCGCKSK